MAEGNGSRGLGDVEVFYAVALRNLRAQRDNALSVLRSSQSEEMAECADMDEGKVYSPNSPPPCSLAYGPQHKQTGNVSALVIKHIAEMDSTEAKWERQITQLIEYQKKDYQKAVSTWASFALSSQESISASSPSLLAPHATSSATLGSCSASTPLSSKHKSRGTYSETPHNVPRKSLRNWLSGYISPSSPF